MGVKSLWSLLQPVGRPVQLETMEGKTVAIDSSIWIYQFQATMRDKEGRGLTNAHVLGFLRRICKLLFYGMKPVFVFDGGAPALKKATLGERRRKKTGAAASHVKIAERLLAAQMRREALNQVQAVSPQAKGKGRAAPAENQPRIVFLEEIDPNMPQTTPGKPNSDEAPNTAKKRNYRDHDPYRLPEVDMDARIANATRSVAPDPRLATEEELRAFIEEMRPEDFDVNSAAFRELPTEVQYEIVGDLRLKSRQTSYTRLQQMLRAAPTPMDFSKQQIKNLQQRNALTQQLLVTTDTIGQAHISIPVRIASERNKEYVLIKNEGADGGWILGIRDEGTKQKPIVIDHESESGSDEDVEMEEAEIPPQGPVDEDSREYHRQNALLGIGRRSRQGKGKQKQTEPASEETATSKPLFDLENDEELAAQLAAEDVIDDKDDDLALAIQQSLDHRQPQQPSPPPIASSSRTPHTPSKVDNANTAPQVTTEKPHNPPSPGGPAAPIPVQNSLFPATSRLETALSIANAMPSPRPRTSSTSQPAAGAFGAIDTTLLPGPSRSRSVTQTPSKATSSPQNAKKEFPGQQKAKQSPLTQAVIAEPPSAASNGADSISSLEVQPLEVDSDEDDMEEVLPGPPSPLPAEHSRIAASSPKPSDVELTADDIAAGAASLLEESESDGDLELQDILFQSSARPDSQMTEEEAVEAAERARELEARRVLGIPDSDEEDMEEVAVVPPPASIEPVEEATTMVSVPAVSSVSQNAEQETAPGLVDPQPGTPPEPESNESEDEWEVFNSASGATNLTDNAEDSATSKAAPEVAAAKEDEHWDAAEEMDPVAEEGEFAQFMSQVKGRDLDDVRREIDDEIRALRDQRRAAMRDSEDVTQQMVNQIMTMLRLFGIPYITAPMEAEAQCAALVELGLVDGIITDDSDVFLFGGQRVFKNMFNQSKTVECFLLTDLARELGLDRQTLVMLAYLLGSDYVDGLPGVGPVVAMELLKEFPGEDGLHKFKDWWTKVQSGRDKEEDNRSMFRRRFKKKFKDLYLPPDWPNAAVRDQYYHPTVDDSREPFRWGLPDLDALRILFASELGWGQGKVDETLLPIIQRMNRRQEAVRANRQGDLVEFVGMSSGTGTLAPRRRQAYASKRLQQVVSDFRKSQRAKATSPLPPEDDEDGEEENQEPPKKRARTKTQNGAPKSGRGKRAARGRGRGRGGARASRKRKDREEDEDDSPSDGDQKMDDKDFEDRLQNGAGGDEYVVPPVAKELRPRPKPRPAYRVAGANADGS